LGEQTDCPASFTGKLLQRWIISGLKEATVISCVSQATLEDARRLVTRRDGKPKLEMISLGLNYPYRELPPHEARARLSEHSLLPSGKPFVLHVVYDFAADKAPKAEVAKAAADIGYPVALKALGFAHKSDAGGVALGLAHADALAAAHADMVARLDPAGFSVEAMADLTGGVEMIVGARRDPRFGPVVLVGLGGLLAEVLSDTAVELAPVSRARATAMLDRLRGAALLYGFRGRPAVDVDALADAIVAVSVVAAAHPEIAELDVNPVVALPSGALALDAHLILTANGPVAP
jgi:acyl-CoA synthetase (NDP forming)